MDITAPIDSILTFLISVTLLQQYTLDVDTTDLVYSQILVALQEDKDNCGPFQYLLGMKDLLSGHPSASGVISKFFDEAMTIDSVLCYSVKVVTFMYNVINIENKSSNHTAQSYAAKFTRHKQKALVLFRTWIRTVVDKLNVSEDVLNRMFSQAVKEVFGISLRLIPGWYNDTTTKINSGFNKKMFISGVSDEMTSSMTSLCKSYIDFLDQSNRHCKDVKSKSDIPVPVTSINYVMKEKKVTKRKSNVQFPETDIKIQKFTPQNSSSDDILSKSLALNQMQFDTNGELLMSTTTTDMTTINFLDIAQTTSPSEFQTRVTEPNEEEEDDPPLSDDCRVAFEKIIDTKYKELLEELNLQNEEEKHKLSPDLFF